jgi:hypothetical protein
VTVGLAASEANSILDDYLTTIWVKLHTGDPGSAGTSNAATETTRKQASFGAASAGAATNSASIIWEDVAATETVTHVSFWSAESGGTFKGSDALDSSVAFTAGESGIILAGALDFAITPIAA